MKTSQSERGQAVVLIALALLGMIAFAALSIDASMVFAEYRSTQNVADSAAMSAAGAKCNGGDPTAAATKMLAANGYTGTTVKVNTPPKSGPYAGLSDYYEVVITTTLKPVFSGFIMPQGGLTTTARAVSSCSKNSSTGGTQAGLGGEISMLALSETAANAFQNTGASKVIVDGGVYINSNNALAFNQTGSSTLYMNWMQVRGSAQASGAFGINPSGTGKTTKQIVVGGNFSSSGSGEGNAGAYFVGGNLTNGASVALKGTTLSVGGSVTNSGAGGIIYSDIVNIGGGINNSGSGYIQGDTIFAAGNVTANGAAPIKATGNGIFIGGNVDLSGSAKITGKVTIPSSSTIKITGGASMAGPITKATTSFIPVTVNVPVMADPLKNYITPPTPPTGSCTTLTIQNWGPQQKPAMVSGTYYCDLTVGGSADVIIPPGTYWVDKFDLSGAAKLDMSGVNLFITGKGYTSSSFVFHMGGSTTLKAVGTMIYIKNGSFGVEGASGFNWSAPASGPYQGLALYMDRNNTGSTAAQTGSTTVTAESGTWYAPSSACKFGGATGTVVKSQFICSTINVHGSSELTIKYDGTLVYQVSSSNAPPSVSLME